MSDHPRLRAFDLCPCCGGHKPRGLVSCWDCFDEKDPMLLEEICDIAERALLNAHRRRVCEGETIWTLNDRGEKLYGVPNYDMPGVAERVRREVDLAYLNADPPRGGLDTLAKMVARR